MPAYVMRISDLSTDVFSSVLCLGQIAQHFLDSGIIDGLPLDRGAVDPFACSIGDELQSAHAVAADRGKEAIGVDATGTDFFGDTAAQGLGVREERKSTRLNSSH